ncbi:MAG: M60 family metallopeptidase [Bacteroidaceae bacterium]|nr:M60 family metallopeptidase [Bacteroidaceae bacterium]MBQ8736061.1 M60 family metallopeptidase [Bacteroidaceae bacterium]
MKSIFRPLALATLLVASTGVFAQETPKEIFSDNFNKSSFTKKNWTIDKNTKTSSVKFVKEGADKSRCVKITNSEKGVVKITKHLTGLNPNTFYRVSAKIKTQDVAEGRGAILYLDVFDHDSDQPWNASKFIYGTNDWQEVYMDFVSDSKGETYVSCALGFPGGTYNGGKAKGTVWYDDVKITETPKEALYIRESEHMVLAIDPKHVTVDDKSVTEWLKCLDKAYEAYEELLGCTPYGGAKIRILTTPGMEPGYWALAGNPILWNDNVDVKGLLTKFKNNKDWGFGILHEIGHTFSAGTAKGNGYGSWNWNDEIFANFRMSYALDKHEAIMSQNTTYMGDNIGYYKRAYKSSVAKGNMDSGDAIHYTLMRIAEIYGWDVYKKAFRKLYNTPDSQLGRFNNNYEKFLCLMKHLSEAATEIVGYNVDVTRTCYTPKELEMIKKSLTK